MSGVYTNLAKKRVEQSQDASQTPPKATEPQNQSVDTKVQEQKDSSEATTPQLSEPAQQKNSNENSASTLASKIAL
jgi:hypothetical protein